ncbi:hypothetical protein L7F22_007628 [Adiantum nelumboides]|nr:hypothetical protein [Adiantum nelumboides]
MSPAGKLFQLCGWNFRLQGNYPLPRLAHLSWLDKDLGYLSGAHQLNSHPDGGCERSPARLSVGLVYVCITWLGYIKLETFLISYTFLKVEGLIRLMESEHIGPFNLGNPGEFTMLELVNDTFQRKHRRQSPQARIQFKENREDDLHKRKPNTTKAKNLLHWEPIVPLKKCLPLMVEDFLQRILEDPMGSQL